MNDSYFAATIIGMLSAFMLGVLVTHRPAYYRGFTAARRIATRGRIVPPQGGSGTAPPDTAPKCDWRKPVARTYREPWCG